MDDHSLWKLIREVWVKIEASFDPAIKPIVANSGLSMREWMLLVAALTFEPEDTTPSHLLVRGPYTSSDQYLIGLENAADLGYLENLSTNRFRLSEDGRNAVMDFIEVAREAMEAAELIDGTDARELADLLECLVKNSLETPPPPNTWSINLSYKLLPTKQPPMPYIEQAISCLSAYRDDAHLASWQSSGLSAIALESLTLIWIGQVSGIDQLTEKLSSRGHSEKVYLDALAELRGHKYISGIPNMLRVTEEGKLFRDRVEASTDHYFFTPWSCLNADEKDQMAEILMKF